MAKEREVNIIVDAKNKSRAAFLEVKKDLRGLGDESEKGLGKLTSTFDRADKVIYSFADRMKWMDKIAKRTFQGTAAAAGIYIGATLKDFTQLNDGISKVNTLYDQTAESQKKMYQDSIQMFGLMPSNFEKITQGIYDTISAGADPRYASMMARKFGMGGVAGDADMDVVTKAAMGTMNAYKAEVKDLDRILDLQFMTVKKGITSYEELASSLGTGVLASAASAGITMEELYGSIAMITKNAIPAAVATTSLNQMFNKFTDTKVIKEFKNFGVEIQDAKKNTRPLIEIMKDLNYQFDKRKMTSEQRKGFLKEIVGSEQAARAITPLLSDMKEFEEILNSMDDSSGAMKGAFDDRLESMKTQMQLFWNNLKAMGIEQVYTLEPLVNTVMEPFMKKQKLQLEIMDTKDSLEFIEDPKRRELTELYIEELEMSLANIKPAPVEELRDALAESVKQLELLNPPLAKFLDTIGNFVLNFVGDEGAENRAKAGKVAKTAVGVYGFKKVTDIFAWFNKNFKWIGELFKKDPTRSDKSIPTAETKSETLTKTLKTMNVNADVVNVYGKSINNIGGRVPGGSGGTPPVITALPIPKPTNQPLPPGQNSIPLPGTRTPKSNIIEIALPKKLTTGVYVPKEYQVGGKAFNDFKKQLQEISDNKNRSKNQNELFKKWQAEQKIDNNINMRSNIKVEAPKVDTKVYVDGKNIPVQRVEVDYRKVDKHTEIQARRYGRPELSLY